MTLDMQRQIRDVMDRLERLEKFDIGPVAGTYTPTYDGAVPGTTTYTFQDGAWVRIGNIMIVRGQVAWSGATGTGNARISLPFTAGGANYSGALYLNGVTFAAGSPEMLITGSTAYFTMGSPATNAAPTVVAVEAAGNIIWTCSYVMG